MHLASVVSSCSLLLLLGALPGWAANDDPIEKVIEGINRGLTNAEREVGKALEGINNGITHAGREVEKVFNGLSHMGSQAGKELDKGVQGLNSGLDKGAHPGVSTGQHQHGGGATTTLTSGASVNRPFISFPTLWQSIANIIL
ncbi:suprabasin isoform X2 [Vulpes lagopus]|uniref:suprabasin isoform X2 n=1 Tax=Vulpes lagopus TaxID=494514 RepID=UPI001BCA2EEB|nr:suprabasin isoform X2 [Vulpes lagopus]